VGGPVILALRKGSSSSFYSFLFGLGFALQLEHTDSPAYQARYFRRILGLLLFWCGTLRSAMGGDILMSYVFAGIVADAVCPPPSKTALGWGIGLYAGYLGLIL